jgi:hypothetical protein
MYQPEQAPGTPSETTELPLLCSEYRAHGWWVDADQHVGRITLVVGGSVGALLMPAELGARVHRILSIHMLAGPILAYPVQHLWVFLTEPNTDRDHLPDEVAACKVTEVHPGKELLLPVSRRSPDGARWIVDPESGGPAPPWRAVVSATRRAMSEMVLDHSA